MTQYLDDLVAARIEAAYDRSQLAELGAFSQGSAVTLQHFQAFYEADPVEGYEIIRVVRLDRRAPDTLGEQGTPEWDIEVRFDQASGPVEATFGVVGEVLAQVTVVPVALDIVAGADRPSRIEVDGVPVDLERAEVGPEPGRWRVVVLDGRHTITLGDAQVQVSVDPLTILEGEARVEGTPGAANPQALILG